MHHRQPRPRGRRRCDQRHAGRAWRADVLVPRRRPRLFPGERPWSDGHLLRRPRGQRARRGRRAAPHLRLRRVRRRHRVRRVGHQRPGRAARCDAGRRGAAHGSQPVASRALHRAAGGALVHGSRRVGHAGLAAEAARLRPVEALPPRDGGARRPACRVRLGLLPRVPGARGHGLPRLLHEPARVGRIRRGLPPRGREGLGREGLHRPDDRAGPGHRAHWRGRHRAHGHRRRLVRRLHDQLGDRAHEPFLGRGVDALDLEPRQRVLAARHRPVGRARAWAAAVA